MGSPAQPLSGPARGSAATIAQAFLRERTAELGLAAADLRDLVVTGESLSRHTGIRHVHLRQRIAGIEVVGSEVQLSIGADGSVLQLHSRLFAGLERPAGRREPALDAAAAMTAAARSLGLEAAGPFEPLEQDNGPQRPTLLGAGGIASSPIAARLVFQPACPIGLRLAWQLDFEQKDAPHLWRFTVDAQTGEILEREDYTSHGPDPGRG